jgi:hypothetical protein
MHHALLVPPEDLDSSNYLHPWVEDQLREMGVRSLEAAHLSQTVRYGTVVCVPRMSGWFLV